MEVRTTMLLYFSFGNFLFPFYRWILSNAFQCLAYVFPRKCSGKQLNDLEENPQKIKKIIFMEFSCSHERSSTYKVSCQYNKLAKFSCNGSFHFLNHFRYNIMCLLNSLFESHKDTGALSLIWGGHYKWLDKQSCFACEKFLHTSYICGKLKAVWVRLCYMAIASSLAGPVLAGPVFRVVFENPHAQSAISGSQYFHVIWCPLTWCVGGAWIAHA